MRHFTLITLSLLVCGMPVAWAQKVLPTHQTEYIYDEENGDWMPGGEYTYRYDADGNILQQDYDDGSTISRTINEWSKEGLNTLLLEQTSDDGGQTFTNSTKRVQTYDMLYPRLITLSKDRYQWAGSDWVATGDAFRRNVTRDADGNVLSLTVAVPYNGAFDEMQRYTNTVDPTTRQINSFKFEELGYSESGNDLIWKTSQYLRNLVWKETNGQLVGEFSDWMSLGNKLSSATITSIEGTDTVDIATVCITYDDKGGYVETIAYTDEPSQIVTIYTVDDANGSNTLEEIDYMDMDEDGEYTEADICMRIKQVQRYDEKGSLVEEQLFEPDEDGTSLTQTAGTRYDISYDTTYPDAEAEVVMSEWNYESRMYVPIMRIVSDRYTDVTAISGVKVNSTSANGVYNLQGMKIADSLPADGHGILIVRKDGKSVKVMR